MNANDARIARLYTTQTGGVTEDNSPNAGPPRSNTFDLILQLEAGNVIGQGAGRYSLTFTAINDDTAAPEAGLGLGPFNEQFEDPLWKPSGGDFVRTSPAVGAIPEILGITRYTIAIPAALILPGQFHYNLRFVNAGFQVVDITQSNLFILV
jgi:hypothetical protein